MTTGVFGGTFNPIHIGHLILAQEVAVKLGMERVIFVPAKIPPIKEIHVSPQHRYNMVKLAIAGNPFFSISDIELAREGISYTYITLQLLKQQFQQPLMFIIGSDNVSGFTRWYEWQKLLAEFEFAVGERPGYGVEVLDSLKPIVSATVYQNFCRNFVNIPYMNISASEIRAKCQKQQPVRYLLPESVENYIKIHKLYTPEMITNEA